MDKAVYTWYLRAQNIPLSGELLCVKARQFAEMFDVGGSFKATTGWLPNIRAHHRVVVKNVSGEEAATPLEDAIN